MDLSAGGIGRRPQLPADVLRVLPLDRRGDGLVTAPPRRSVPVTRVNLTLELGRVDESAS